MKNGRMQAKDLDTLEVLRQIHAAQWVPYEPHPRGIKTPLPHWATRWDLPILAAAPERVGLAKIGSLIRSGLVTGCNCGCRGDLELTDAGRALL